MGSPADWILRKAVHLGAVTSLLLLIPPLPLSLIERPFCLAPLLVVPLTFGLLEDRACRLLRAVRLIQPIAGITLSPHVEIAAAGWLALSVSIVAVLALVRVVPRLRSGAARWLPACSPISALPALALAVVYAAGEFLQKSFIDIPQMARTHGLLQALGFVLCGLLAWTLERRIKAPART